MNRQNVLPLWCDLPEFKIYLDQLLDITNHYVEPITGEKLTKTMMHNYTKANIIIKPVDKRYVRIHLAGAIVVSLLKIIFSLDQIKCGLQVELTNDAPDVAYDRFARMYNDVINKVHENESFLPHGSLNSEAALLQYQAILAVIFRAQSVETLKEIETKLKKH